MTWGGSNAIPFRSWGPMGRSLGELSLSVVQWFAAFLYWMSVAGQSYGATLGYAPFPPSVTMGNQQIVELLKYDGVPAFGDVDFDGG